MELVLDVIVCVFWGTFFLATLLGVMNEYRSNQTHESNSTPEKTFLADDDPVFLVGP
ncbi:MAG: hypothetical protein SF052_24420 [Bacteroidia bacterium]|nr:hypothetical protein [Bacteroidia bacterium]